MRSKETSSLYILRNLWEEAVTWSLDWIQERVFLDYRHLANNCLKSTVPGYSLYLPSHNIHQISRKSVVSNYKYILGKSQEQGVRRKEVWQDNGTKYNLTFYLTNAALDLCLCGLSENYGQLPNLFCFVVLREQSGPLDLVIVPNSSCYALCTYKLLSDWETLIKPKGWDKLWTLG